MKINFARIAVAMLCSLLVITSAPKGVGASTYSLVVDGSPVANSQAELRNGQLMVAVRALIEAMGGGVDWLEAEKRVTASYNGSKMAFWLGSQTVYLNGVRHSAPVAPYVKNGRTMVPAWWVSVRLGAKVQFVNSVLRVETGDYHEGPSTQPSPVLGHPLMNPAYVFPFPRGASYDPYPDTWGDSRSYGGQRFPHEGTDILAKKGTPLVSVASGKVVRFGWNTLGGYRVTIQLDDLPEYRLYYAHMDRYAPGIYQGAHVHTGQLLGYVGSTGEGPERTEGKFVSHLHFGIYAPDGAVNPYRFLKYWERNKVSQ